MTNPAPSTDAVLADHETRITALEIKAGIKQPPPPPPPLPTFDIVSNYGTALTIGEVVLANARLDKASLASGVTWTLPQTGTLPPNSVIKAVSDANNRQRVTALAAGSADLIASYADADHNAYSAHLTFTVQGPTSAPAPTTPAPSPVVVAPPPAPIAFAPAVDWDLLRACLMLMHTDFNYNWDQPHDWPGTEPTPMEIEYAKRYDVSYSGCPFRHARLKKVNPRIRCIPYTTLNTSIIKAGDYASAFVRDYVAWCEENGIDAASAEGGWLHSPNSDLRVVVSIWGSNRNIPDPTSQVMRRYQIDRMKRLAAPATVDGLFLDEYGSNQVRDRYKLSSGADAERLQALCDAQTSLLAEVADAIKPKQLIINTAAYKNPWDAQCTDAAKGAHMEQINDAVSLDLWSSAWPYIDARLAAGSFVNMVCLRDWGHYESVRDAQVPPNAMDTHRGKLFELASYYMVVTNPRLLGLSIENGDWALDTPIADYLAEIDADIGTPLEKRQRVMLPMHDVSGLHQACYFQRRFSKGLVVLNPVWNRDPQNYGDGGAVTITLPTDRKYGMVLLDGSVTLPVHTVTLRTPEAAIFVAVP